MDTVTDLIEQAVDHLVMWEGKPTDTDIRKAIRCLQIARGRFDSPVVSRTSKLLYDTMDQWATFEKGQVRVEVICQLLAEEGLLRENDV